MARNRALILADSVDAVRVSNDHRSHHGKLKKMNFGYGGIVGVLILIGDIWALINILQSSAANDKKLLWVVVVVLLPLLGLILWFFLGPRDRA